MREREREHLARTKSSIGSLPRNPLHRFLCASSIYSIMRDGSKRLATSSQIVALKISLGEEICLMLLEISDICCILALQ